MRTHYELLAVTPDAPADEIKRAFRREIAKYHPDKVQHLGAEFQEIAAVKAAELTQAYKTLTDAGRRAEYDALVAGGGAPEAPRSESPVAPPPPVMSPQREPSPAAPAAPSAGPGTAFSQERAGVTEFVRRAAVARFRSALMGEFGRFNEAPTSGFDVTCVSKPAFWTLKTPPRILGRVVPIVDGPALSEAWALASKMKKDGQRELCVFLMGPVMAPAAELANAIVEQRRRPTPAVGKLSVIPVNTSDWNAHVPTDAPPVVKSLLARLKA